MSKFMNVDVPRATAGWVPIEETMLVIIKVLSASPYMLGDHFSAADVLYGTTLALFAQSSMMPKATAIEDYVKRIVARPAYVKALALDAGN